jgi:eukaryotic-like serine/threonine-protein kinase
MSELLSPADVRLVDQICDRFEADCQAGRCPNPADFLEPTDGSLRAAVLRQLLLLDWEYRYRSGESPLASDYHSRFPLDSDVIESVNKEMTAAASTFPGASRTLSTASGIPSTAEFAISRYDILETIGKGGIGVVYRGLDRQLGRELAIKVLRDQYHGRSDAQRRFIQEARVSSRLQHPAILPVYEQGWFDDRRPYFTMKLVRGHTLAALLRERPSVDLPRYLGIFEQVCQAIAYAHAQGVVHRDLKPANIMVGAFGEVQVMDWGFAKVMQDSEREPPDQATEPSRDLAARQSSATQSGALMGTPAYMSPEQARGETALIDPRADVFALGAILCEILTGRPPYVSQQPDEVCRQAAMGDLVDALFRLEACGVDAALRDVARRCLEVDRSTRPADASIVAQRITAFIQSAQERVHRAEVERAGAEARASAAQAKVCAERRVRRLLLALAGTFLLGAGLASWQAVTAERAQQSAESATTNEAKARETAESKSTETRAVLDFVEDKILSAARPKGKAGGLGSSVTLRQALEAVLPVVDKSFTQQPLTEARLRTALGNSFYILGDGKTAAAQYRIAFEIYCSRLGTDDVQTLNSMNNLANSYNLLGRSREALELHKEAFEILMAKFGPDNEDTLNCMNNLGDSLRLLNQNAEALKIWEETLSRRRAKYGPDDDHTLESMQNLTYLYALNGQPDAALKLCLETLDRRKAKLPPNHPSILETTLNLANCYDDLKLYPDALSLREQLLPLLKETYPPEHPALHWGMHNLANSYSKLNQHEAAYQLRKETLALRQKTLGRSHPDTLRSMRTLAQSLIQLDRGIEAVPLIDECVRRAAGQVVHPKLILGVMDLRMRHFENANDVARCRETANMWEQQHRPDADSLYTAARYRAVAAKVTRNRDQSEAGSKAADAEADCAMAWLTQAVAAGKKPDKIREDRDFSDLLGRADFQQLVTGATPDWLVSSRRGQGNGWGTTRRWA